MADDKRGREKQAQDEDKRQRQRDMNAEIERGDEAEPSVETAVLGDLEDELETLEYPATGATVVAAVGDREIEAVTGTFTVDELIPDTERESFEDPEEIRIRVQRPTIAAAMARVADAGETLPDVEFSTSQLNAYERTFQELRAIDADDDDEGIRVVGDWFVEQVQETGKLPGSRALRRRAAKFCRANGYEVRNDEWLGI